MNCPKVGIFWLVLRFAASTRGDLSCDVVASQDEADERWRDVLFELAKRAKSDADFRERVERTGVVLDNFEAVLDRARGVNTPASAIRCRDYWWGFQLEIPHPVLVAWGDRSTELTDVTGVIGAVAGPAGPFTRRAASFVARELAQLATLDHGAGVYVSMTWMAPNVFIPTAVRR